MSCSPALWVLAIQADVGNIAISDVIFENLFDGMLTGVEVTVAGCAFRGG